MSSSLNSTHAASPLVSAIHNIAMILPSSKSIHLKLLSIWGIQSATGKQVNKKGNRKLTKTVSLTPTSLTRKSNNQIESTISSSFNTLENLALALRLYYTSFKNTEGSKQSGQRGLR
jgi:hypothetical protein